MALILNRPERKRRALVTLDFGKLELYGRTEEKEKLRDAIRNSRSLESPQVVLISGYSGSGKSSLVESVSNEVAFFCRGKFDQIRSSEPFQAIVPAFNELCRQIFKRNDQDDICESIRKELGSADARFLANALIELKPLLKLDKVETVAELQQDVFAFTRLKGLFCTLIKSVCSNERSAVLVIDDLQWSDVSSVQIIKALANAEDVQGLTLALLYRSNEIDDSHVFQKLLEDWNHSEDVVRIQVGDLSVGEVKLLLSDLLECRDEEKVTVLAGILHRKTKGNPFFLVQLLQLLEKDELLFFSTKSYLWEWDCDRILAETGISDNIVDLVVSKIRRLPHPTQEALKVGACLGSRFDALIVASITKDQAALSSPDTVVAELEPAVAEDMLNRNRDSFWFRFCHDRIMQGAYSLLPASSDREELHLRIGRHLSSWRKGELGVDENWVILVTADQLNRALPLIIKCEEKLELARLNLAATTLVKGMSAFYPAVRYLETAIALLEDLNASGK